MTDREKTTVVLMPGLNGTDGLFKRFIDHTPAGVEALALSYPVNESLTYAQLTEWVGERLSCLSGPVVLVGESFSGPLSLFVANRARINIVAVVLVASFVVPPRSSLLKALPWTLGFALTKPLYGLRSRLSAKSDIVAILSAASAELQKVAPRVLADRVRQTLSVDAVSALADCRFPILYLQAAHDLVVPKSALQTILRIKKSVSVSVLPTQHFLLQSAPAEAWQAITSFLDGLATRRPQG